MPTARASRPAPPRESWLTKRELAGVLRCSPRTIERLRPPALRVGGQNRYRLSQVEAYLRGGERRVQLVEHNPFSNMRLPTAERTEQFTAPSMDEYRALLEARTVLAGYGPEFRAMIQFAAWAGVRAGELQALRWDDLAEETLWIRRARRRDGTEGRRRTAARARSRFSRRRGSWTKSPAARTPTCSTHRAEGRSIRALTSTRGGEVRAPDGLRRIRWHDLRHFCATRLLEMGLDQFAVSIQLGHTDGGTLVMARYGHPYADAARGACLLGTDGGQISPVVRSGSRRTPRD